MSSNLREALRSASASIELRLRNEQKQVRTQKKIAKVQEMLTSEDEIKKRKQRLVIFIQIMWLLIVCEIERRTKG